MITTKTVLVLGAGASAPYGFPVGSELRAKIVGMDPDEGPGKELVNCGFVDGVEHFVKAFGESGCLTIDDFLEKRPKFEMIGKHAIARFLLNCEDPSNLIINDKPRWYHLLRKSMEPLERIADNELSIVTFNYDRSLEHYLYMALKQSLNWDDNKCRAALEKIPIIHIYGSLGHLPWQVDEGTSSVDYYPSTNPRTVATAAEGIRVIHERDGNDSILEQARIMVGHAVRVVFLGFGYHATNMKRIGYELKGSVVNPWAES